MSSNRNHILSTYHHRLLPHPQVQIGWALDGVPIMGPYKDGVRTENLSRSQENGGMVILSLRGYLFFKAILE